MADPAQQQDPTERRRFARFEVNGAELVVGAFEPDGARVSVSKPGLAGLLSPRFWRVHALHDLSCGGLRLSTDLQLRVGQELALSLHVREWCQPMRLRGTVRWVRCSADGQCTAGVQFAPFDDARDGNPAPAREAIRRLHARYAAAAA